MRSLYKITEEAVIIASQLEEGETTPELENALVILQSELQEKAINYAYVVKSFEDDVTAINEEIKRLTAIKTAKVNAMERMKQAVTNAMLINRIEKVSSPTLNLSLRRSESIEVDSLDQLPEYFKTVKTTVTADKTRIKKAIKDGQAMEGARIVENFNLQIK
jgi:hypothetical protein